MNRLTNDMTLQPTIPASSAFLRDDALDLPESYDEDLVWILERLVARAGGEFALIFLHITAPESMEVLAKTGDTPSAEDFSAEQAANFVRESFVFERRRQDDANLMQLGLPAGPNGTASYRLLCMGFQPAPNIRLIVATCRNDARHAFNMIHEGIAKVLYPVLSRYIRLWWLHRTERRQSHALSYALDLSTLGVVLLDRRGELLFANSNARNLLDLADGLRRCNSCIAAEHASDGIRLQAAIQHAIHCNVSSPENEQNGSRHPLLSLRRGAGKPNLILTVAAITRRARDLRDPAVIIYVLDPGQDIGRMLTPLCRLYGLTASEERLAHHLVSGKSLAEAAQHMHVQPQTARAYLKQIFCKTSTHRQADLVRLFLSSMLPTNTPVDLTLV